MSDFLKITSADNWFKQHPEKIAGVEYETTSFFFPIMVKGTKEDVLRVTGMSENKLQKTLLRKINPELAVEPFIGYFEKDGWKVSTENQSNGWVHIYGTKADVLRVTGKSDVRKTIQSKFNINDFVGHKRISGTKGKVIEIIKNFSKKKLSHDYKLLLDNGSETFINESDLITVKVDDKEKRLRLSKAKAKAIKIKLLLK